MLPENVAKVDPLIQNVNLLSINNIQLLYMEDYWILYLILQITMLFLIYHHPTVITLFFFRNLIIIFM